MTMTIRTEPIPQEEVRRLLDELYLKQSDVFDRDYNATSDKLWLTVRNKFFAIGYWRNSYRYYHGFMIYTPDEEIREFNRFYDTPDEAYKAIQDWARKKGYKIKQIKH